MTISAPKSFVCFTLLKGVPSGRHRHHATLALIGREGGELIKRATFLERRRELQILEFEPDVATRHFRQCRRMVRRRTQNHAMYDVGRGTDMLQSDFGELAHGRTRHGCSLPDTLPKLVAAEGFEPPTKGL